MFDRPECIRCGVCCSSGPCKYGKEGERGKCIYLFYRRKMACCLLLEKEKIKGNQIGIGEGCVLRVDQEIYEYYKKALE